MKRMILVAACASLVQVHVVQAQQSVVQPPKAWASCAACHAAQGSASIGPSLIGVVGRQSGTVPGFGYSRAMKSAGIVWDDATLSTFLTDPQQAVPGNRMPFPGVADPDEVAQLVRFLRTLK